ncbi:ATP-binding protein [Virgibacillus soli]|uniref:HAMP domain-containing sensor histidine kinase n=1 Tax=Paracerasibacillus soli TaxID=480284 RepID=UPI0035EA4D64
MKSKIALKLFALTTLLCLFILAIIFVGQTILFKYYYVYKKEQDVQEAIQQFESDYREALGDTEKIHKLERALYESHNTWIAMLNQHGNLQDVDFYIDVQVDRWQGEEIHKKNVRIPLHFMVDQEDVQTNSFPLEEGISISLYGIERESTIIPYLMQHFNANFQEIPMDFDISTFTNNQEETFRLENKALRKIAADMFHNESSDQIAEDVSLFPAILVEEGEGIILASPFKNYLYNVSPPFIGLIGTITQVHLPEKRDYTAPIYMNSLFLDRVKNLQADILSNEIDSERSYKIDEEFNGIPYKVFIEPIHLEGKTMYLFAMTSLQPVDEVLYISNEYYLYFTICVMILILFASFYYSKKISRPLLKVNQVTEKIANLDFSESVTIKSNDELGTLANNINILSQTLHDYIQQLQMDIEKEKQLENTRKEFISGVSHELKTPLSIMKSTISILHHDIAKEKRSYYFQALEQEVDKMDRLIVDMLELAKYESGIYQLEMGSFYIDELIERVCKQLRITASNNQIFIRKNIASMQVIANEHRIEQVMTNFLTNAIRHSPRKGTVFISGLDRGDYVKVCVENEGEPLEQTKMDKVWDRFYRGDVARQRSKGETGLGLAICRNILELHGVKYGVENTKKGVLFYFYLRKVDSE